MRYRDNRFLRNFEKFIGLLLLIDIAMCVIAGNR